jgi:hypothetical protein
VSGDNKGKDNKGKDNKGNKKSNCNLNPSHQKVMEGTN